MADAVWHGTKEELIEYLRGLPSDMVHGPNDIRQGIGEDLLTILHEAFLIKSQGGVDEAGIKWKELEDSTVEKKRARALLGGAGFTFEALQKGGRKAEKLIMKLLTKADLSPREAAVKTMRRLKSLKRKLTFLKRPSAIRRARQALKKQLLIMKYLGGHRGMMRRMRQKVSKTTDILIETHDLERSLDPHATLRAVVRPTPDGVELDFTAKECKPWHHTGFPIRTSGRKKRRRTITGASFEGVAQRQVDEDEQGGTAQGERYGGAGGTLNVKPREYFPPDGRLPDVWWQRIIDGVTRRFGQALMGNVMAQEQRSR